MSSLHRVVYASRLRGYETAPKECGRGSTSKQFNRRRFARAVRHGARMEILEALEQA